MLSIKTKKITAVIMSLFFICTQVQGLAMAAPVEFSEELANQQPVTTLEEQEQNAEEPLPLPAGSLFEKDSALAIVEDSAPSAISVVDEDGNVIGSMVDPDEDQPFGNNPLPLPYENPTPLSLTKEEALEQAAQDLVSRFTLTQEEKDKILNNNLKTVDAEKIVPDGVNCSGWSASGIGCMTSFPEDGYHVIFKLHDQRYEYRNGFLKPENQVAVLALNAFMEKTNAPLSELSIESVSVTLETDAQGNQVPNEKGLYDVVIASKKNGTQAYDADFRLLTVKEAGLTPIPMPFPSELRYLVTGTTTGTDAAMYFASLEEATNWVKTILNAAKAGSGDFLTMAQIGGPAFEVFGSAILASYELDVEGGLVGTMGDVIVYLSTVVKSVDGTSVASIDWRNAYETTSHSGQGNLGNDVIIGNDPLPLDPRGQLTNIYNEQGQLVKVIGTDPLITTLEFTYDAQGGIAQVRKTYGAPVMSSYPQETFFDFATMKATETYSWGEKIYSFRVYSDSNTTPVSVSVVPDPNAPKEVTLASWENQEGLSYTALIGVLEETVILQNDPLQTKLEIFYNAQGGITRVRKTYGEAAGPNYPGETIFDFATMKAEEIFSWGKKIYGFRVQGGSNTEAVSIPAVPDPNAPQEITLASWDNPETDMLSYTALIGILEETVMFQMTQTKEQAVAQASQDLANRFTELTQEERDKLLNNNIKLVSAVEETWNNGCVGWEIPGGVCTQSIVTGYKIVFKLHDIQYEYHNGMLDPAKQVAILSMNAFMQNTDAALNELKITSVALKTELDSKGNEIPNEMGLYEVVITSKKNGVQKYDVDYYNQIVIATYVLDNGSTFNHNITAASGFIKDESVTSHYADVTVLSVDGPAPATFTKPGQFPSGQDVVLSLIGTYQAGEDTFAIYGLLKNEVYELLNGKNLTFNPADKTGFVRDGSTTQNYTEIFFQETQRCFQSGLGLCSVVDYMMVEGFKAIGAYTKQEGEAAVTYTIFGREASTDITLNDGRVFHFDAVANTGWVLKDGVREDYNKILFSETGRAICPSNPESGEPCLFARVNDIRAKGIVDFHVRVGSYEVKMGNTVIYYTIYGEPPVAEILMQNGETFHLDIASNTGWIKNGGMTTNYKNVSVFWSEAPLPSVAFSPVEELNTPIAQIGSYEKAGDTFFIYGELENETYELSNGKTLTVNPADKTGFVKEGVVKENYKNISFSETGRTICPSSDPDGTLPCQGVISKSRVEAIDGDSLSVKIGSYEKRIDHGSEIEIISYDIYGEPVNKQYTMTDGKVLTANLNPEDGTGFVVDGSTKSNFKDITFQYFWNVNSCQCTGTVCPPCAYPNPDLIEIPEGFVKIGSYIDAGGGEYFILGQPTTTEITMQDGRVFTYNIADNTGWVSEGSEKDNYKDILFFETATANCPTNPEIGAPCTLTAPKAYTGTLAKIGSYVKVIRQGDWATTINYDIYGEFTTTEITLSNGKVFTHNPADNTGFAKDGLGAVKTNYVEIGFVESMRCTVASADEPSLCSMIDSMMVEGFVTIGSYTKTVGQVTTTYMITGKQTTTEITLSDGSIFTHNPVDNTGFKVQGPVKSNFEEILFGFVSACDTGPMGVCSVAAADKNLLDRLHSGEIQAIGSYSEQKGNTIWTYAIYGEPTTTEITMADGHTFTHNPTDNTGFVKGGDVKKNYVEVGLVESMNCPAVGDGSCSIISFMMAEGFEQTGVYTRQVGNGIITYMIIGKPTTTEITIDTGKVFIYNEADKTASMTDGNGTQRYGNASILAWQQEAGSPALPNHYPQPDGVFNNDMTNYLGTYGYAEAGFERGLRFYLYGTSTATEITLDSGLIFTHNAAAHTGWLQEGNVKDHFEDVTHELSQQTTCPSNPELGAPCEVTLQKPAPLSEGYTVIGTYTQISGNVTSLYRIIGKATIREITLENGQVLTLDLREPALQPIVPVAEVSKTAAPKASIFRGGSTSAFSTSFSQIDNEEKKRKKRKLRRAV